MIKSVCPNYCAAPFCITACPTQAISLVAKSRNENICIDLSKCNHCGICRMVCTTFSRDKALERKLPWLSVGAS
jgi:Fe-S-cluster-containing hydrogenase component 2